MNEPLLKEEPAPSRASIATQALAVVLLLSMVVLTFTTTRKDKAWKNLVKQIGLDQIDKPEAKKD